MIDKPDLPDEPEEKPKPKLKREPDKGDGGSGKPPRSTAVGTGGPDDERNEWEKRIADLRRYDLEEFDLANLNPHDLISWPLPQLTFVRIDSAPRAVLITSEKEQQEQPPIEQKSPNQLPPRMYRMEDALTGLHAQKANLAYYVHGNRTGVRFYMGISLPASPDARSDSSHVIYQSLKSILHSVYEGIDICEDSFDSDQIKTLITPNTIHAGLITGTPTLSTLQGQAFESQQIERITTGMQGLNFGILVVSVPIPGNFVSLEEFAVSEQMQRARENKDPEKKRRIKYYLELQDAYLKHLQLGTAIGSWQVGVYFFAPDRSVFVRLQSLIRATFTDETNRPTPLRTHEVNGLKPHIEQFGLLRNQRPPRSIYSLLGYRFLTPLNSRMLSAYVHLPSR